MYPYYYSTDWVGCIGAVGCTESASQSGTPCGVIFSVCPMDQKPEVQRDKGKEKEKEKHRQREYRVELNRGQQPTAPWNQTECNSGPGIWGGRNHWLADLSTRLCLYLKIALIHAFCTALALRTVLH